jgi:CheY-like chemotaxis protein/anti-sigma regulatory factor (Ser/Thr protein kinase)
MERQLRHLVRLVDELLDVARIARGKIALRPATIALKDVVQCALDLSASLVQQHRHALSVRLPPEPVYLHADATRLAQVLGNLLNNAAKYTPAGGRIALAAWTRGTSVAISVRDNGVGVPAEDLPRIFDLFTQVGRSLDMAQGGLGIGLALSRQLVELHGGRIGASSEGPGRGSVFTVELPTCAAPQRPPAPSRPELPAPCQAMRVLVVDDNVDGANTLAALLQTFGHLTEVAYDGANALAQAERFAPQAAFLDLSMPGMDGFELARQMQRRHAGIALVALTGWATEADKERSLASGFAAHLTKPVDLSALQATLSQVAQPASADRAG